jgi:selenocysteine lyase/cysteine desulfurase
MRDADEWELRIGRAADGREEDVEQKRDEARAVIAALIGADPGDVYLVGSPPETRLEPMVDPATGAARSASGALDATLAAGAVAIDVSSIDVDLLYLPGDRWLLGPEGTGAIWSRRGGMRDADLGRTQVLGLARSLGWLEMYVTLPWIYERGEALTRRLRSSLASTTGVEVVTPEDALATVVVFRLTSWPTDQALDELRRRVFAIIGATPDGAAIRASVAWFNTEEELDRFSSAVAEIAMHTPETLPRRPSLVVH